MLTHNLTNLFKLFSCPQRLEILYLCSLESLSISEIAELLNESQSQMSKKLRILRDNQLLSSHKQGTKTYLKSELKENDLFKMALSEGQERAHESGNLEKLEQLIFEREQAGKDYFNSETSETVKKTHLSQNIYRSYLNTLSSLLPRTQLAIDLGTGDGAFLEVLSPLYQRVIGVDRSPAQISRASKRIAQNNLRNVKLIQASFEEQELVMAADQYSGADLICISMVLHHCSSPLKVIRQAKRLLKVGGSLLIIDYQLHQDETMHLQGDVWLGFDKYELESMLLTESFHQIEPRIIPKIYSQHFENNHLSTIAFHAVKSA